MLRLTNLSDARLAAFRRLFWPLALVLLLSGCSDGGAPHFPDLRVHQGGDWGRADRSSHQTPPDGGGPGPDSGPPPGSVAVHTVDVGTGNCLLVLMPDPAQPALLVDCGQDVWKSAGVPSSATIAHVRGLIGKRALAVVITHPHADHYSLVDNIIGEGPEAIPIATVWLGSRLDRYTADGERTKRKLDVFRKQKPQKFHHDLGRAYHSPYPAGEPDLSFGKVKAYVLAVNESEGAPAPDVNGLSLVLLLRYGDFFAVFPGDADGAVQDLALKHAQAMGVPMGQTKLLLAAHHGSGTAESNNDAWVTALRPRVVTYSAGRKSDPGQPLMMHNGHPFRSVVARFEALPSLARAKRHTLFQGEAGEQAGERQTSRAHYLSASNGTVVVESNGLPGNLRVRCVALPGTTRDTACALQ